MCIVCHEAIQYCCTNMSISLAGSFTHTHTHTYTHTHTHREIYWYCISEIYPACIFIPPANCVCGWVYCFHFVRPPFRPCVCVRVSVTFCFLNILKNHRWNFIKFCKHIHMNKANATDKKLRARDQYYWSYFPL